jgi:hypothetical protein
VCNVVFCCHKPCRKSSESLWMFVSVKLKVTERTGGLVDVSIREHLFLIVVHILVDGRFQISNLLEQHK